MSSEEASGSKSQDVDPSSEEWTKERAEKNRQKALLLRKTKLVAHPYSKENNKNGIHGKSIKVQGQKVIDTGGGFLIEENDDVEKEMLKMAEEPLLMMYDLPTCEECGKEFNESYLYQTFDLPVCNTCRDPDEKHSLITKSEAKDQYLLKDYDFDKREPPLKYIVKKNPHNSNWGEMKLYLHLQIEKRALEVWESEEKLIEEKEKREIKRQETKIKRYNKKVKQLRMQVRSSVYDKTKKSNHVHNFGPDTYNDDTDDYTHTCVECNYEETYEKM